MPSLTVGLLTLEVGLALQFFNGSTNETISDAQTRFCRRTLDSFRCFLECDHIRSTKAPPTREIFNCVRQSKYLLPVCPHVRTLCFALSDAAEFSHLRH